MHSRLLFFDWSLHPVCSHPGAGAGGGNGGYATLPLTWTRIRVDTSAFRCENNTARERVGNASRLALVCRFGEVYDITDVEPGHSIK